MAAERNSFPRRWDPCIIGFDLKIIWEMSDEYPVAATVVGLVLGRMVESELIRSYQLSAGDILFLLERPVALVFAVLLILSLCQPLIFKAFGFKRDIIAGD